MSRVSVKAESFTESVIREMTRLAIEHDAVNLAQGLPDFACPPELKQAACAAIEADINQYAITWTANGAMSCWRRSSKPASAPSRPTARTTS